MTSQHLPEQLRLNIKDSIQKQHFKKALKDLLLKYNVESNDLLQHFAKDKILSPKTNNIHRSEDYKIVTASDSIEFGVSNAILRDTRLRQSQRSGSPKRRTEHITYNKVRDFTVQSISAQTTRKCLVNAKKRPKTAVTAQTSPNKFTLKTARTPLKIKTKIVDIKDTKIKPSTPPKKFELTRPITVQAIPQNITFPRPWDAEYKRSLDSPIESSEKPYQAPISKHIPVVRAIRNQSAMKKKSSTKLDQPNKKRRRVSIVDSNADDETESPETPINPPPNSLQSEVFTQPSSKYPILNDETLIQKFLAVTMTNNQKGRIRQVLKEIFTGVNVVHLPDVIHNKILSILKSSENLTDTDLRKIRVLYNMLKIAIDAKKQSSDTDIKSPNKIRRTKNSPDTKKNSSPNRDLVKVDRNPKRESPKRDEKSPERSRNPKKERKEKKDVEQKVKGQKRYVVFVGNLPPNIDKEQILYHFSDLRHLIKDIRIPVQGSAKKSAIAYVELYDQPTFEMALSKHHSMLGSKRINVLYTTQKNTKISKAEAKATTAKLLAMVKSGQLAGSVPKKRSQRRAKQRQFLKLQEQALITNNK